MLRCFYHKSDAVDFLKKQNHFSLHKIKKNPNLFNVTVLYVYMIQNICWWFTIDFLDKEIDYYQQRTL